MLSFAAMLALLAAPDTTNYTVFGHERSAGAMRLIRQGDSTVVRFHYQDRQRGPRRETRYWLDAAGIPVRIAVRTVGTDLQPGSASESFERAPGSARWIAGADTTTTRRGDASYYWPRMRSPYDEALLARFLLRHSGRDVRLLPFGRASASVVRSITLNVGATPRALRLVAINGVELDPVLVWLDEKDELFASAAAWFITVRQGAEPILPELRKIEHAFTDARDAATARRFGAAPAGRVLVRNGDVFDSERGVIRPRTSVLIEGNRIVAVGPAEIIGAQGARVIDATGRTVLPGLWDMHAHVDASGTAGGLLNLAAGVTTIRDMASDLDKALSIRSRAQNGLLISPRVILAGFIEGPGHWAGPSDVIVRTETEARRWVARYDSLGFRQIKLYNLLHPDLVPTIAEEAKRRGMRLSGHVPRGLSVPAAIALGFDEINHAAFLLSTFFQDSLFVPRMRAYSQVAAAVAPTFDTESPEFTSLVSLLRDRGTVIDGTFNLYVNRWQLLPDGSDPVFGTTMSWFPPLIRRDIGALSPSTPQQAARAGAGSATYIRILKRMYDAGVTLVPGTDNIAGLSLQGELELYERAGIPAAAVLQIATIVPARVMKDEKEYGSIAPGKIADLVIVKGRPAERVRDLRRTETVIRAGVVYSSAELYRTAGLNPQGIAAGGMTRHARRR